MNDLPARYTALVAKRPGLAVKDGPNFTLCWDRKRELWRVAYDPMPDSGGMIVTPEIASALIFRRLCEAMPMGYGVARNFAVEAAFCVVNENTGGLCEWAHPYPDPLSALFAFWESQ